jgi:hypothetical protein
VSQYIDGNYKNFTAGGAIAQHLRVKLTAGVLVLALAVDRALGTMRDSAFATGDNRAVRLRSANGTSRYVANGAIAQGVKVYGAAGGKITATPALGAALVGDSLEAAGADGDVIEVLHHSSGGTALGQGNLTFTPAAGGANVSNVTVQVVDSAGNALAGVFNFDLWLSDAATGANVTATTASGTVTAGASGVVIGTYTAKKSLRVQTDTTGKFILAITDTAKTGFYVAGQMPGAGQTVISSVLVTGNYG